MNPIYLGDGVYACFDGYHVWLTTGTHVIDEADNKIALEPEVLVAFMEYLKRHAEFLKSQS